MLVAYFAIVALSQATPARQQTAREALAARMGQCVGYVDLLISDFNADRLRLSDEMAFYWKVAQSADPTADIKSMAERTRTAEMADAGQDIIKAIASAREKIQRCRAMVPKKRPQPKAPGAN